MDNFNNPQIFDNIEIQPQPVSTIPLTEKYKWMRMVALVLGIASISLCWSFGMGIPVAITGIVFACLYKHYTKKFCHSIWLNIFAIILSIICAWLMMFFFMFATVEDIKNLPIETDVETTTEVTTLGDLFEELETLIEEDYLQESIQNGTSSAMGTWDLKAFNGGQPGEEYLITCSLNPNGTFTWSKYDDEQNNCVKGTYTIEKLDKGDNNGTYYSVILTATEFVVDGELQSEDYISKYEVVVTYNNGNKEILFYNIDTMSMYYGEK